MVNRIAHLCQTKKTPGELPRFGDLRRRQPLNLLAPACAVSPLIATEFLDLLRASISLNLVEKCQLILSLRDLSKETIVGLIVVMRKEQQVFRNLSEVQQDDLRKLEFKALTDWWRVEHWFWQHGYFEFQPLLFLGKVDPKLPANVEFLLQRMSRA